MYIFRTHPRNIPAVVRLRKHALDRVSDLQRGDRVLISETLKDGDGRPPIRCVMPFLHATRDFHDESLAIWGRKRNFILDFASCRELAIPFDMRFVKVTDKEYGPGGPVVRVHPADEYAIDRLGLLR